MGEISMICAMDENNGIGVNNELLWHLPDDFKWFKKHTIGHPVIMGRKTMESLPKALPGRLNVVLSRSPEAVLNGFVHASTPQEALELCEKQSNNEIFIIGGGVVYELFLPKATKLYLTRVQTKISEVDTYFPSINYAQWDVIHREFHPKDEKHAFDFILEILSKR